jgi:hypothetical protein
LYDKPITNDTKDIVVAKRNTLNAVLYMSL